MDWSVALADPAALRAQGLFVAEGRLVLERILAGAAGGPDAIVAVLATPAAARALALESPFDDRLTIRTPTEMEAITGFNFHRGVLALVRRPPQLAVGNVVASAVTAGWDSRPYLTPGSRIPNPESRVPILVVLEHLVDVDNVGSAFRNARAFGAAGVLLDERCPDPLYRKAVRTSLGHVLEVPWARAPIGEILEALRTHGVATVGLTPHERGTPNGLNASSRRSTPPDVDDRRDVRATRRAASGRGRGGQRGQRAVDRDDGGMHAPGAHPDGRGGRLVECRHGARRRAVSADTGVGRAAIDSGRVGHAALPV